MMSCQQKENILPASRTKPVILVYWYYFRKDLLVPFLNLVNEFEWHFVLFRESAEDHVDLPFPRHYWSDYGTPYALISQVRPRAVIFFELSNFYSFSLNIAAKQLDIPTCILGHGMKLSYEYYEKIATENKGGESGSENKSGSTVKQKLHLLGFYLSNLRLNNVVAWPALIKYLIRVYVKQSETIFPNMKFPLRKPRHYLILSEQNMMYHKRRDGATKEEAHFFGHPILDKLTQALHLPAEQCDSYFLLLDNGNLESFGIATEEKNAFLHRLNEYALQNGAKLYVKLHPADFRRKDLYQHHNLHYFREADTPRLVRNAKRIFGISSTMILPLIAEGRITLFRLPNNSIQDVLEAHGVSFVDFFNFTDRDLDNARINMPEPVRARFIWRFLYSNDGRATERLAGLLHQIINATETKLPAVPAS